MVLLFLLFGFVAQAYLVIKDILQRIPAYVNYLNKTCNLISFQLSLARNFCVNQFFLSSRVYCCGFGE